MITPQVFALIVLGGVLGWIALDFTQLKRKWRKEYETMDLVELRCMIAEWDHAARTLEHNIFMSIWANTELKFARAALAKRAPQ